MNISTLILCIIFVSLLFPIQKTFSKDSGNNWDIYKSPILNGKILKDKSFQKSYSSFKKISLAIVTASALNIRSSPKIKNNITAILVACIKIIYENLRYKQSKKNMKNHERIFI